MIRTRALGTGVLEISLKALIFASLLVTMEAAAAASTKPQQLNQTKPPVMTNRPFIVVWNAPTQQCRKRFNVDLNLGVFDMSSSPSEGITAQSVTVFYYNRLGLYPLYTEDGTPVNGGLPQNASLQRHLEKARLDIEMYVARRAASSGPGQLAVIDWEEWRPQWVRNWQRKDVYRQKSRQLVRERRPNWPGPRVSLQAQREFDAAALAFMNETIRLARGLRPRTLWGFYLFPDCYNYDYKERPLNYTGRCPAVELRRNDDLRWLWEGSTALFPSVYMERTLASSRNGERFVRHRVQEALRVAATSRPSLPVFVYSQPAYAYTFELMAEVDLQHSIGESAALGAAGVILWGDIKYARSRANCEKLRSYIAERLGPYVVNVTSAARLCGQTLCRRNGRCARKDPDSGALLHLSDDAFEVQRPWTWEDGGGDAGDVPRARGGFVVSGRLPARDVARWRMNFECRCFSGWVGTRCSVDERSQTHVGSGSPAFRRVIPVIWLMLLVLSELLAGSGDLSGP
ncbi:hyaluronidase-2-like [Lethenteron reissneri]|uniref:hyaluronidase-2-like n=1 Tax=Lethenteron reissneri TaxID=7753 RepID=UPI002AB66479|nr:hyaluronidase-2-like [Lethenteron reissneri]